MRANLGRRSRCWSRHMFSAALFPLAAVAAEAQEVSAPRVDVIGSREQLKDLPSTANIVTKEELDLSHVFSTTEALRKVPGVNVRDEEGFGLRPNIGIRGLNPTRSTKVLLLEDGIPLSYAPYGDNASYYHPPVDRFERIEVLKGFEQIRFGPLTAGGVINYITPLPSSEPGGFVSLAGGNRHYFNGHARYSRGPLLFDYIRKQGEGSRDNTYVQLNDFNLKLTSPLGEDQALTVRANAYTEDSQVTYSGLTQAEFDGFGAQYNPFKNDFFEARRYGLSLTHEIQFDPDTFLITNVYWSNFQRDWWRQSSSTTDGQCGAAFTAQRTAGQAVDPDLCNSIQGRLREYYTYGVEPRLRLNHGLGAARGELELSVRAHYETQDRRQENGTSPSARSGTVSENNERDVAAYSFLIAERVEFGRFAVTPGARVERMLFDRTDKLTNRSGSTGVTELIPGIGATFEPNDTLTFFGGVHKGYSPPRVEDVISNAGVAAADVPEETAVEAEIGVRGTPSPGFDFQFAAFRNHFSQQVVVGSVAGAGLPLATGETLYAGGELSGRLDLSPAFGLEQDVYLRAALTYLPTASIESPFLAVADGTPVQGNREGNRVPYAPRFEATIGLGYNLPFGLNAEVEMVHVSEQYSDFANSVAPSANGQAGLIDAFTIWNLSLTYTLQQYGLRAFFAVKNVADEVYIADRTRGILPGTPRLFQAGVKYAF
jgi:Fe(3+) dicitrate transport protein